VILDTTVWHRKLGLHVRYFSSATAIMLDSQTDKEMAPPLPAGKPKFLLHVCIAFLYSTYQWAIMLATSSVISIKQQSDVCLSV